LNTVKKPNLDPADAKSYTGDRLVVESPSGESESESPSGESESVFESRQ
jgi:hypothetical protein